MQIDNFGSLYPGDFTYNLPNTSIASVLGAIVSSNAAFEGFEAVKYYQALLGEQVQSGKDLHYWLFYVNKFDTGHMVPFY